MFLFMTHVYSLTRIVLLAGRASFRINFDNTFKITPVMLV